MAETVALVALALCLLGMGVCMILAARGTEKRDDRRGMAQAGKVANKHLARLIEREKRASADAAAAAALIHELKSKGKGQ